MAPESAHRMFPGGSLPILPNRGINAAAVGAMTGLVTTSHYWCHAKRFEQLSRTADWKQGSIRFANRASTPMDDLIIDRCPRRMRMEWAMRHKTTNERIGTRSDCNAARAAEGGAQIVQGRGVRLPARFVTRDTAKPEEHCAISMVDTSRHQNLLLSGTEITWTQW